MELKQILARQPGPEVAEQVQLYQQTLKDKTKQLKSMASELNMYEAQVKEYQYELERLSKELQEAKKKYYMQKRKEQQARCVQEFLTSMSTIEVVHNFILSYVATFKGVFQNILWS
jgi:predicted RNase H-like nuclease (RuvC/YqgF family)